jgi:hypothetical protein
MLTLPDAAPMRGIAQPALLIKRVRSNAMFRKFRHRSFNHGGSDPQSVRKVVVLCGEKNLRILAF